MIIYVHWDLEKYSAVIATPSPLQSVRAGMEGLVVDPYNMQRLILVILTLPPKTCL